MHKNRLVILGSFLLVIGFLHASVGQKFNQEKEQLMQAFHDERVQHKHVDLVKYVSQIVESSGLSFWHQQALLDALFEQVKQYHNDGALFDQHARDILDHTKIIFQETAKGKSIEQIQEGIASLDFNHQTLNILKSFARRIFKTFKK